MSAPSDVSKTSSRAKLSSFDFLLALFLSKYFRNLQGLCINLLFCFQTALFCLLRFISLSSLRQPAYLTSLCFVCQAVFYLFLKGFLLGSLRPFQVFLCLTLLFTGSFSRMQLVVHTLFKLCLKFVNCSRCNVVYSISSCLFRQAFFSLFSLFSFPFYVLGKFQLLFRFSFVHSVQERASFLY